MARAKAGGGAASVGRALIAIAAGAAFAAGAIGIGALAAPTPREAQSSAEDAVRRLDLQTGIAHESEPLRLKLPAEALWIVIAVALAVLLYSFRDMIPILRSRGSGAWTQDDAGSADVVRKDPAVVVAAADELAAQGRYVEAMRVLLLRGLADIRARLDEPFADSLTSREILRSTRLPEQARESLRDVVSRVEWTYFGEHPAAREDYVACRTSFNALARAMQGSMAA